MRFVILRILRHNELGMFHSYRRLKKEGAKQRAINFDGPVVDRVFPSAKDDDIIELELRYETDRGIETKRQRIKRQEKNWRLEGNCPKDRIYDFVDPGCLFAMVVDAGAKPAVGAWAVYPADHEVTEAITSHAESSQLTAQSMIALYGSEGGYTLDLLCSSKPDLFGSPSPASEKISSPKSSSVTEFVHLPPNPRRLVRILASVGHSLPSAVADIVDNAISADATKIDVTFREPDKGQGRWMMITDNGRGMNKPCLEEAMRIGSDTEYDPGDLGKYGYGLKGASWSQAESFTVATKLAGRKQHHMSWDDKTMNNWEASKGKLDGWIAKEISLGDHGTCVFWRDMRPPKQMTVARGVDPYTAEIRDLERHLGLVFHRFMDGRAKGRKAVKIRINGVPVQPNDPVGHSLTRAYDKKPIRVPTATTDEYVEVQAFLLPSEKEIKALYGGDAEAARKELDRIGMYGRRNQSQGVYIYRNDRLIQWGGWHQIWATSDEKTKLARVVVDFGNVLDDQFSVNISKQKVALPQQLQEHIKTLANEARKDSRKKYLDDKPKKPPAKESRKTTSTGGHPDTFTASGDGDPGTDDDSPRAPTVGKGKSKPKTGITARKVKNASFCWRVAQNMTGAEEIQISEDEAALQALFDAVSGNSEAIEHLAKFLKRLDEAGVQEVILKEGGS